MLTIALYLYSLLHLLSSTAVTTPPYTPTDYFLLNCGSSSNATSQDQRSWDGDATSKFSPSNIGTTSSSSTATEQDPSVTDIPFLTARIFTSKFTYTFPVSSGPKFIRLYFYPATYSNFDKSKSYSNFDKSKSYFSVTAANYTLLTNFSAFLTVSVLVPQQYTLIKEFIVNVRDTQKLDITFNPSPNSYAFINGIEVVSIPNNFYMKGDLNPIPLVGSGQSSYIDNNAALETLYRLNVGGNDVSVNDDTGMYRAWYQDKQYTYGDDVSLVPHLEVPIRYTNETPNYTAPAIVYTTARTMGRDPLINLQYNLTWIFTVDSGFLYLARLHFCEFQLEVTRQNERVFSVYMNNQTADQSVDVIYLSGDNGVPVFKDYVLSVPRVDGHQSKVNLWLAMHPNMDSKHRYNDAILNGLEIFKINQSDGSLAGPNPESGPAPPAPYAKLLGKQNSKTSSSLVVAVAGGVIGGVFLISVIGFMIFRRRRREIAERNVNGEDGLMSPSDPLLQVRKTMTDDDDDMLFSVSQSNATGTSTAESGARSGNSFGSHQTVVFSEIMNPNGRKSFIKNAPAGCGKTSSRYGYNDFWSPVFSSSESITTIGNLSTGTSFATVAVITSISISFMSFFSCVLLLILAHVHHFAPTLLFDDDGVAVLELAFGEGATDVAEDDSSSNGRRKAASVAVVVDSGLK
ncbi:Receptor-like protein kinase FERONIA [Camellia lanceoleosa]|uniref:Receptor-like protein kinase FERONIA n=1 Tax=Camellia lanceoleosa TaxID=1840588 RepID=A0ACC0IWF3_9ERIC|nr:Receptor-like protein kinase FERONIA [Camellia lanceoleosa]